MVTEEKSNGNDSADEANDADVDTTDVNDVESKFAFKCDDCSLGMESTTEHVERLLRQSAQGKLKESRALAQHWRDYQRLCSMAAPLCPGCNTHFPGFIKLCQHVVRRVDFEENTTPADVKKELSRLADAIRKKKRASSDVADSKLVSGLGKLDDDADIPEDSTGHRDVFNLLIEFLCGISDDMVNSEYQMELLTQIICPRSQPKWALLHLKKDGDAADGDDVKTFEEIDDDDDTAAAAVVEKEEQEEDKEDKDTSIEQTTKKDTSSSNDVPVASSTQSSTGLASTSKGLFRCLMKGCSKEFITFKDHLEEVIFVRCPRLWQSGKDIETLQGNRANHWSAIFGDVKDPDFQRLHTSDFLAMCPVCGAHFRGGGRSALNGLLNHLSMARRLQEEGDGGSDATISKRGGASGPLDRTPPGGVIEQLGEHTELLQWLVDQLVDCVTGRASRQQVADVLWSRFVCDHGATVLDIGECGETRDAILARRKERNNLAKKRKRQKEEEIRKKSVVAPKRPATTRRRGESVSSASATRVAPGPTSAKKARVAVGRTQQQRRPSPGAGPVANQHHTGPARGLGDRLGGVKSRPPNAPVVVRGGRPAPGGGHPPGVPTYSAECSLCTTTFPAHSQQQANAILHRHLMDTLFGARVGRTGADFPPHRYWHQVAPSSRRALCPQCHTECENLDALAQHLAVVIDGDNNPLSRSSHVQVARVIVDRFVEHMSGSLAVEGLRDAMARFAVPEPRLGVSFGGGAEQRHGQEEGRSMMAMPANIKYGREHELMGNFRRPDDGMAAFGGGRREAEFGDLNRRGGGGVTDEYATDNGSYGSNQNTHAHYMSGAGGGIGMHRSNDMFRGDPMLRNGTNGGGGGGGGNDGGGAGWTPIASTTGRRF